MLCPRNSSEKTSKAVQFCLQSICNDRTFVSLDPTENFPNKTFYYILSNERSWLMLAINGKKLSIYCPCSFTPRQLVSSKVNSRY